MIFWTRLCTNPCTPAGERARGALQQRADPGEALLRQVGGRLIGQPFHVDLGDDLVGDLVGEGVLDRRIMDQRRHVGDIPAGVGHLVRRPHSQHRNGRQDAAENDQQRRDRRAPAEPAAASLPRQAARFGHLGARASVRGARRSRGPRSRALAFAPVGAGHGSPPLPSNSAGGRGAGQARAVAATNGPGSAKRCPGAAATSRDPPDRSPRPATPGLPEAVQLAVVTWPLGLASLGCALFAQMPPFVPISQARERASPAMPPKACHRRRATEHADSHVGRAEEEQRRSDPGTLAGAPGADLLLLQLSGRVDRQNPDGVGGGEPRRTAPCRPRSGWIPARWRARRGA